MLPIIGTAHEIDSSVMLSIPLTPVSAVNIRMQHNGVLVRAMRFFAKHSRHVQACERRHKFK